MAKGDELVKYVTEQLVNYANTSKTERREIRKKTKAVREPWLTKWFGAGGMSMLIWKEKRASKRQK